MPRSSRSSKIRSGGGAQQGLLLSGRVSAKVQGFQPGKEIRAGYIDHVKALLQDPPGNGQRSMGLAQACIANEQKAFPQGGGELLGIVFQVSQQRPHVAADAFA